MWINNDLIWANSDSNIVKYRAGYYVSCVYFECLSIHIPLCVEYEREGESMVVFFFSVEQKRYVDLMNIFQMENIEYA